MSIDYTVKFEKMRIVGKWTTVCLNDLEHFIEPGISTEQINMFVKSFGEQYGLINAQYRYQSHGRVFPAYACTSLNEVLCHGIPNKNTVLRNGDIIKVDITFIKDKYHGDACRTYIVGKTTDRIKNFVDIAHSATQIGCQQAFPGNKFGNIGKAIEEYCNINRVKIARDFVGHGIGEVFHDFPAVSHTHDPESDSYNVKMKPGDTFTIEPILIFGGPRYRTKRDGWTTISRDGSLTAQFEKTIGITEESYEVFCE